jgi:hypothetical protein
MGSLFALGAHTSDGRCECTWIAKCRLLQNRNYKEVPRTCADVWDFPTQGRGLLWEYKKHPHIQNTQSPSGAPCTEHSDLNAYFSRSNPRAFNSYIFCRSAGESVAVSTERMVSRTLKYPPS